MRDVDFYQGHLDRVSRSFAFCIRKLESPLRQWVSLSYLICRILDTVEDSQWSNPALREAQYLAFENFMGDSSPANDVRIWAARFPENIPDGEKKLLADSHVIFEDIRGLPPDVRASIRKTVRQMSAGMKHYSSRQKDGSLRLTDLADVNRYCYFVAGVVGELLTRLLLCFRPSFRPGTGFMTNAFHFGLFLQKVNLLKDQRGDEREGRFLIPDRMLVLSSLRENAQGAVDYLTTVPTEEAGYRVFCAWSLFLGAASLAWIEKSYEADDGSKIPRSVTEDLLAAVESLAQDNEALRAGFEEHFPELPALAPPSSQKGHASWFVELSGGSLDLSALTELRMI